MSSITIYHSEKTLPYVYKGTHPVTGEFYIGMRFANKRPSSIDLGIIYRTSSKIVEPKFDEFEWIILAEFFNKEDAYDFEQQLIHESWDDPLKLNRSCFYNCEHRFSNINMTIEDRIKCGLRSKGRKLSEETKAKMRKKKPEGTGARMSAARTGVKLSKEHCEKISVALTGKKQPQELIEKRVAACTGLKRSEESCKNISDSLKGHHVSAETRKKLSDSVKAIPKVTCQYCGKQNPPRNHAQHHGDRCKMKPTSPI